MGLGGMFKKFGKKDEPSDIEKSIKLCAGYANLWQSFFEHFSEDVEDLQVTEERETSFLKIQTVLASRQFELVTKLGEDFKGGARIMGFMSEVVNLDHLKGLSDAEYTTMQVRWHEVFLDLHKARGRLMKQLPPPPVAAQQAQAPAAK